MKNTNRGNDKNYIILLVRKVQTSYLRMSPHNVVKHFKKCVEQISFNLLLISFVFYVRNYLEKQTENSGVLLNCTNDNIYCLRFFLYRFFYVLIFLCDITA